MGQLGFWDREKREQKLDEKNPLLQRLNEVIPWQEFRPLLERVNQRGTTSQAGRKPTDVILMFKLLVLQHLFNLSDDELEYQANDRVSFMKFLGLGIEGRIPDAKTVWLFRQQLTEQGSFEALFEQFDSYLRQQGYEAKQGQIVDASLVPVPKQRNRRSENQQLRNGEIPKHWSEHPRRRSQKDTEARWTKQNGESHFGYKNHINVDVEFGFIRRYQVTDAAVHDSQALPEILDIDNQADAIWADSAYRSQDAEWVLETIGFDSQIHERAYRNFPLTEQQQESNREKSRTRAKVEHVFGDWVTSMGGKLVRSIGKMRVAANIGLINLTYNFKRYVFWEYTANA